MAKIFIGKIGKEFPEQLNRNLYAGGLEGEKRYGGIQPGDYVFPIYRGQIQKLWRVKEFSTGPNSINNREGAVHFEVIREYQPAIQLTTQFIVSIYFAVDIVLLNKASKQTQSIDFWELKPTADCPDPADIDFTLTRNYYLQFLEHGKIDLLKSKEKDIRVLVDKEKGYKIVSIQEFRNGTYETYQPLQQLYEEKNKLAERYSLKELLEFALEDNATNKERYIKSAIRELDQKGIFQATSPTGLYDNILVGRRKTFPADKPIETDTGEEPEMLSKSDEEDYSIYEKLLEFNPNLILYGPPGTGKTYTAQAIIEYLESKREKRDIQFNEIQQSGRVEFVTFHQSYSYEDFIEGLRPQLATEADNGVASAGDVKYIVNDGILKRIANKAALSQLKQDFNKKNEFENVSESARIWKVSLGARGKDERIFHDGIQNNFIAIGWLDDDDLTGYSYEQIFEKLKNDSDSENPTNDASSIHSFINEIDTGDIVLIFNDVTSIRALGVVQGDYYFDSESQHFPHKRAVKWLRNFTIPVNILKYNNNVRLTMKTVYELHRFKFPDIKELLSAGQNVTVTNELKARPYYLIIDEINRGNISKIFGELLTLLEEDKRDNIKVKLPYSQKEFTIPRNLIVIGTMNTADRSIAVIDTALRRRFVFKELEPNSTIVKNSASPRIGNIDLGQLMDKLNSKLLHYNDRDHRIGHSYFLQLTTADDLKIAWYYQIIPLLMEYFYNDGERIASVISDRFINKSNCNIKWIENEAEFLQALEAF